MYVTSFGLRPMSRVSACGRHEEEFMASSTKITENRAKAKRTKMGKKRKAALSRKGTTPPAAKIFGDSSPRREAAQRSK